MGVGCAGARVYGRRRPRLPDAHRDRCRRDAAGRSARHPRAADRRSPQPGISLSLHCREPCRRERKPRTGACRQAGAGRAHALRRERALPDQPEPLWRPLLRCVLGFRAIAFLGAAPTALIVNPSFPAKTLAELVDHVRKNPGQPCYVSAPPPPAGSRSSCSSVRPISMWRSCPIAGPARFSTTCSPATCR